MARIFIFVVGVFLLFMAFGQLAKASEIDVFAPTGPTVIPLIGQSQGQISISPPAASPELDLRLERIEDDIDRLWHEQLQEKIRRNTWPNTRSIFDRDDD